jgi:hypothetical protein
VTVSQLSKSAATLVSLLVLLVALAPAETLKIGSTNTAFADPPVPHPNTTPCVVTLYKGFVFNNFNAQSFTYTPPAACPGPWAKVILKADFSISAGIQYDRTANIWIGPTNIYFGTTAEDQPGVARNWEVERDLTDYSSIFTVAQDGTVDLGNEVNSTYTGVLHGSASLLFYPVAKNQTAPRTADQVIAFSSGPTGGTVGLGSTTSLLEQTLTLPTNIRNVFLDVFAQSQSNDEFWYTCVPNDVAGELYSCGGTSFREAEVTIDGTPAGVAPVYPWIYTGGIDPYLWIPIPGVQTLNFLPYRVNLTPFAAVLDDGNPHTIALSVFNADSYFSATASLLLYQGRAGAQFTGAVTENTLAVPVPDITENIHVASNGNTSGTVNTRAAHNFQISGYVDTPSGLVTTTVAQEINFDNLQYFKITGVEYEQNIKQTTTIHSVVTTKTASGKSSNTVNRSWPLIVDINVAYNSDGSGVQTTSINQYYEKDQEAKSDGQPTTFSLLQNRVTTTDALDFSAAGYITGNSSQSSTQNYFSSDSTGYCYSLDLTAAANFLTGITDGKGCSGN